MSCILSTRKMDELTLWNDICQGFGFSDQTTEPQHCRQIAVTAHQEGFFSYFEDSIADTILDHLSKIVVPHFWATLEQGGFAAFKKAVFDLNVHYEKVASIVDKVEVMRNTIRDLGGEIKSGEIPLKVWLRASLRSQHPAPEHLKIIEEFYKLSFQVFCHTDRKDRELNESGDDVLQCGGCSAEIDQCCCSTIIDDFHATNKILIEFELLERLAGEILTDLIHKQIESHVQETCKGSFDVSFIASLESWLDSVVVSWLSRLYISGPETSGATKDKLNTFKQKLHHLLYETYTRTRIDQLFTIIIEYPDSDAAIEDLKTCLEKTDLRPLLTSKLQTTLETRLLHPGVNTPDIITAYVASIRSLRHLDPTGILLETVTQPVRQYLRGRDDTMRCVVMSLTEEGPGELADELVQNEEITDNPNNWEDWRPDPIDANAKFNKDRKSGDIISMLVTVYGSKEMFVHEYRKLLADRLLLYSYNTEKEIRYLELLKLRFGDSQLHYCEVMLKDVYDSKRLNTHLHSEPNFGLQQQEFMCSCMILSAQFWPSLKEEKLELPQKIKDHLDVYTKAFETIKGNRTLNWKPHLGTVNLDIELKGRTINLTVSPTHAAIIWYFQDKNQWTVEELSSVLMVPPTVLRRKIAFWQSQGLLREISTDTFLLVEDSLARSSKAPTITDMMCEDDETESIMASAQDQREEELQVFWSYIETMLKNLESLPPERIHQMLKMFASQGPSAVECSLQQLSHFLDRKVREHKLLFSGGFYRLPK